MKLTILNPHVTLSLLVPVGVAYPPQTSLSLLENPVIISSIEYTSLSTSMPNSIKLPENYSSQKRQDD